MISTGTHLDLALVDTDGAPFALEQFAGKTAVFVYFMRATGCLQCNAHVRTLAAGQAKLREQGVEVVVVVPDTAEAAAAWKAKRHVPFAVAVGADADPYAAIGLMKKVFGAVQQSGGVLIDRDGIVRYAHGTTNPSSSYDEAALQAAIAALPV